jgi:endonuclease NucS-like protein
VADRRVNINISRLGDSMLEREMEDLIAAFPEEFFPGHGFVLKGRQQSFAGVGRFDLLFTDRHQTNVLMELKAVVARYDNADQLGRYKEALEAKGETNILMWLVAPHIPHSVKEMLERIGIEYNEIHENEFRRVAARNGRVVEREPSRQAAAVEDRLGQRPPGKLAAPVQWSASVRLLPGVDKAELEKLVVAFEGAVKRRIDLSLANHLRGEVLNLRNPAISKDTVLQLARWCNTTNPLYSDGMEIARKVSVLLFGNILDRDQLGT